MLLFPSSLTLSLSPFLSISLMRFFYIPFHFVSSRLRNYRSHLWLFSFWTIKFKAPISIRYIHSDQFGIQVEKLSKMPVIRTTQMHTIFRRISQEGEIIIIQCTSISSELLQFVLRFNKLECIVFVLVCSIGTTLESFPYGCSTQFTSLLWTFCAFHSMCLFIVIAIRSLFIQILN